VASILARDGEPPAVKRAVGETGVVAETLGAEICRRSALVTWAKGWAMREERLDKRKAQEAMGSTMVAGKWVPALLFVAFGTPAMSPM
jgi:hypothetical protein